MIVNSFNEWPEGSYIEPSRLYGSAYLDLTREWSSRFKSADFSVESSLPRQPEAAPTPSLLMSAPPAPADLPEEEWLSRRSMRERRCIYVPVDADGLLVWVVLCPSSVLHGDPPALSY